MRHLLLLVLLWGMAHVSAQAQVVFGEEFLLTTGPCSIRSGSGAPAGGLGKECDYYFRTDSPYTVYSKTGASTWVEVVRVPGSTGITTVGTLSTGSIASGFGAIDVGADSITGATLLGTTSVTTPRLTSAAGPTNLTIDPTGDIITHPGGADILPQTAYLTNIGSIIKKYLTIAAAELHVETLVAMNKIATIGGRILVGPTTTLTEDTDTTQGYIMVKHNQMDLGDIQHLEGTDAAGVPRFERMRTESFTITLHDQVANAFQISGDGTTFFTSPRTFWVAGASANNGLWTVSSSSFSAGTTTIFVTGDVLAGTGGRIQWIAYPNFPQSGQTSYFYLVTRNLDTSGGNIWNAGDAVFNTGVTGDGSLDLYSISSIAGSSKLGPTMCGMVRTGTGHNDIDARFCIGNLNGWYGYAVDTYGVGLGDNANAWVKIDPSNGVRIGEAGVTYFQVDPSGNALFSGQVTIGTGRNQLTNTISSPVIETRTISSLVYSPTDDGDGTDWGAVFTNSAITPVHNCNLDEWRLENQSGTPIGGSCYMSSTGTPAVGTASWIAGPVLPVSAGVKYEWSFYCGNHRYATIYAQLNFYEADGDLISVHLGPTDICTLSGGKTLADWKRAYVVITAPANSAMAIPFIVGTHIGAGGSGDNPFLFYHRLYFGEAQPGQTAPSPWAQGGTTLITGSYLQTDLVLATTIRSSGATALGTGTGYWLSAATATPTFRVGNPSGNRISWDGTDLTVVSASATIDSTGITIAPSTAGTAAWSSLNAYRFTAATGNIGMVSDDSSAGRYAVIDSTWTGSGSRGTQVILRTSNDDSGEGGGAVTTSLTMASIDQAAGDIAKIFLTSNGTSTTACVPSGNECIGLQATTVTINAEVYVSGVGADGTGKVVCIKSDQTLGTCSNAPNGSGVCTCG